MGRISDLTPALYHKEENKLLPFVEILEAETAFLEGKVKSLPDLIDVDRCPEEYLPYLAALTNCRLIGGDPRLWRRQIRNWPRLLKIKGTEKSLAVFLQSIGVQEYTLHTWFRDASGNLTEEKPDGPPFFNSASGQWHNARTHYFSVDMVLDEDVVSLDSYSQEDLLAKIWPWMERIKPFHAELLNLSVIPPAGLNAPCHCCIHDVCFYDHGRRREPPLIRGGVIFPDPRALASGEDKSRGGLRYLLAPRYDYSRYDEPPRRVSVRPAISSYSESRGVKILRTFRKSSVGTYSFAQAVFDENEPMGSINCVYSPYYRTVPPPVFHDEARYDEYIEQPEYRRIDRFYEKIFRGEAGAEGFFKLIKLRPFAEELYFQELNWNYAALFYPCLSESGSTASKAVFTSRWGGEWGGPWRLGEPARMRPLGASETLSACAFGELPETPGAASSETRSAAKAVFTAGERIHSVTLENARASARIVKAWWAGPWNGGWGADVWRTPKIVIINEEEK